MTAVRLRRKLDSETLHLPELKPLLGKMVEITVQEESRPSSAGVLEKPATDCFSELSDRKPLDARARKALRTLLTQEQFEALMDVASRGGPDIDAIRRLRAASMI